MVDFAFKEFVHEKYTFYGLSEFIQKNCIALLLKMHKNLVMIDITGLFVLLNPLKPLELYLNLINLIVITYLNIALYIIILMYWNFSNIKSAINQHYCEQY